MNDHDYIPAKSSEDVEVAKNVNIVFPTGNTDHNCFQLQTESNQESRKIFQCFICDGIYKHRASLRKHMIKEHNVVPGIKTIKCLESECGEEFSYIKQLQIHLTSKHGLVMKTETHNFKDMNGNLLFFLIKNV